jgi:hypothetical protein
MTTPVPAVRAGQLKPISKAQAAEYTRFDGKSLPRFPKMTRVLPEPFQRTRIEEHHGKRWCSVLAADIAPGDIVPGAGLVASVQQRVRYVSRAEAECLCPDGRHGDCRGYLVLRPSVSASGGLLDRELRPPCPCPAHARQAAGASDRVAAGTEVIITGESGSELRLKAEELAQAFR